MRSTSTVMANYFVAVAWLCCIVFLRLPNRHFKLIGLRLVDTGSMIFRLKGSPTTTYSHFFIYRRRLPRAALPFIAMSYVVMDQHAQSSKRFCRMKFFTWVTRLHNWPASLLSITDVIYGVLALVVSGRATCELRR